MPKSRLGRRNYIQAVGGSLVTVGIAGTPTSASTADRVTVTGTLKSHDGDPVAGRKVYFRNGGSSEYIETDDSGTFETKAVADSDAHLGFYKSGNGQLHAPVKNSVPHIDDLGGYNIKDSDTDLGTIRLERGYLVNLRALDKDGNPVTEAGFGFRADGFGSSGHLLSANEDGYLVINNADFTGIELAESANVAIKIPTDGGAVMKYKESIYVDSPMTIIARQGEGTTIKEHEAGGSTDTTTTTQATTETTTTTTATSTTTPTSTTTLTTTTETTATTPKTPSSTTSRTSSQSTVMGMSASGTENRSKRGFLSNGKAAGDYEFLTDPLFLTVGGFVLSVAGIAQNLIRGR